MSTAIQPLPFVLSFQHPQFMPPGPLLLCLPSVIFKKAACALVLQACRYRGGKGERYSEEKLLPRCSSEAERKENWQQHCYT